MNKISMLIAAGLCLCLTAGCGAKSAGNATASESPAAETQTQTPEASEIVNYESYAGNWSLVEAGAGDLNRISELMPYHGTTDLTIEEIKDGHVKGRIFAGSAAVNAAAYDMAEVPFEGDITHGKMSTSYEDESWGTTGTISLAFEEDKITAIVTHDKQESDLLWGIPEGTFTFLRQIDTSVTDLPSDELEQLEQLFYLVTDDVTAPFSEDELTDDRVIKILADNIGLGVIDLSEFGDLAQTGTEITLEQSVMDELAARYFGVAISKHQSVENGTYKDESYTIQPVGIGLEYPEIAVILQDNARKEIYYVLVDYVTDHGEGGYVYEYQYLIKLQKTDTSFAMKSIEKVNGYLEYGSIPISD